jgi:hypothetical protein
MIYECQEGHISFSKDDLNACVMGRCNKLTVIISPIDMLCYNRERSLRSRIKNE